MGLAESPYGSELEPGLDQDPGDGVGMAIGDVLTVRTAQKEESGAATDGVDQLEFIASFPGALTAFAPVTTVIVSNEGTKMG